MDSDIDIIKNTRLKKGRLRHKANGKLFMLMELHKATE